MGMKNAPMGIPNIPMGMQNVSIGMQNVPIGMQNVPMGMQNVSLGMQNAPMGMQSTSIGMQNVSMGIQSAHTGIQGAHAGIQSAHAGIQSTPTRIQNAPIGIQTMGMQNVSMGTPSGSIGLYHQDPSRFYRYEPFNEEDLERDSDDNDIQMMQVEYQKDVSFRRDHYQTNQPALEYMKKHLFEFAAIPPRAMELSVTPDESSPFTFTSGGSVEGDDKDYDDDIRDNLRQPFYPDAAEPIVIEEVCGDHIGTVLFKH